MPKTTAKLPTKPAPKPAVGKPTPKAKPETTKPAKAATTLGAKAAKAEPTAKPAKLMPKPKAQPKPKVSTVMKVESKAVPPIVPHGQLKQALASVAPAPAVKTVAPKATAAAPLGRLGKAMDRVKTAVKSSVRTEDASHHVPSAPSVPDSPVHTPMVSVSTHLEPAMTRKAAAPVKKPTTTTPAGKVSLEDLLKAGQTVAQSTPIFDASKHLKS